MELQNEAALLGGFVIRGYCQDRWASLSPGNAQAYIFSGTAEPGTRSCRECTNHWTMQHRILTLAAAMTVGATYLVAQGPAFGLKGGLNISSLAVDQAREENTRLGFNAGAFVRTMPTEPFGLQVELLYSAKGSNTTYSTFFGLVDQEVDLNLDYLELPVLASFRLAQVVDLQIGAYGAYLLSANVSTSGDLGSGADELDTDNFNSLDLGLAGGVGFNVGPAQLGVRYLHGLTNVADSDASDAVLGDAKNRCAQFYVAFGIPAE